MREGLLPNGATAVASLLTDERTARLVSDAITETLDPETVAAAAFEEPGGARWSVEIYFGNPPDEPAVRELVRAMVGPAPAEALAFGEIARTDWVSASLAGLKPVEAGRFLVHGGHDRGRVPPHKTGIEIEAALAFGTGHHGTTRGCLLLLERELRVRRPRHVLDVGTGTGVLAIAAARALHRPVAAGEIDPVSARIARENAVSNRAGAYVRPVVARGVAHRLLWKPRGYDLVLANILAKPLRALARPLAQVASGDGVLILSGLLPRDVPGVLAAYRACGFALTARLELEGWASLRLARAGRGQRRGAPPWSRR